MARQLLPRMTTPECHCGQGAQIDRIGAARVVFVAPRRRTQIRQFWGDRYWADVGGEFLLLVAAVMI
jgi:hypothetical protein